ncbi:universal stress protein YxiE-like isoform X2 [Styela clava]|uniref:universal stress protein YxiE-like isoform X2 n=1 Tax=Styela clava TaxID=7725 RepID=UPI00193A1679|nr:universal stress protein YxiE-like isoform X2 [Styela clava]
MAQQQEETHETCGVQRVLIAVDDSENGAAAFDYYIEHVHRQENQLIALHVSDQVKMPTYALFSEGVGYSHEEVTAMVEKLKERNKALEDKYNKKCNDLKIKHKVLIVSEDSHGVGHAICQSAKKHDANLIVVGSRGHGTLRRTILGSVSTYVIHHSHIPTLVCPVHHK